jgi:hypothetical protein
MPSSKRGDILKRDVQGQTYLEAVSVAKTIPPRYHQLFYRLLRDLRYAEAPPEERPLIESIALARCLEAEELFKETREIKTILSLQTAIREHTRALSALRQKAAPPVEEGSSIIDEINRQNASPNSTS